MILILIFLRTAFIGQSWGTPATLLSFSQRPGKYLWTCSQTLPERENWSGCHFSSIHFLIVALYCTHRQINKDCKNVRKLTFKVLSTSNGISTLALRSFDSPSPEISVSHVKPSGGGTFWCSQSVRVDISIIGLSSSWKSIALFLYYFYTFLMEFLTSKLKWKQTNRTNNGIFTIIYLWMS